MTDNTTPPVTSSQGATGAADESWRGAIGRIEGAALDRFLGGNLVCRLACLKDDGAPYVVPCWFEWTGQEFYIIPRKRSVWARYIQRDGRVCLSIDEDASPYRKVQVEGHAEIVEEPNVGGRWVEIARRMSLRYLGEHGPDYLEPTLNQPRWLIRVTPTRMTTWQGVAWHPRYFEEGTTPTPTPTA
jgi:PPOX class probable F420-dependent enzyme